MTQHVWWFYPVIGCASYLLGSTPVGLLVGRRARGVDIREFGSGKTGFTNSLRTLGLGPSILVFVGDLLKGAVPVLLARALSPDPGLQALAASGAVIGHVWPVFAGFKGGRGVATSFGASLVMIPVVALSLLLLAGTLAYVYRYMSLVSVVATLTGAVVVCALVAAGRLPLAYGLWGVVASAIILLCHRENFRRLRNGTEPKIGRGGQRRTCTGNANP